jgi:hypothetical protein
LRFRGHFVGGVIAGAATSALSVRWDLLDQGDATGWLSIFSVALVFSLYPDLDTSSVPQRWFYRAVFGLLLYLSWLGEYRAATILAIVSILPLLDHHRGWTHWRVSPILVIALPAFAISYWRSMNAENFGTGVGATAYGVACALAADHGLTLAAALVGWYTHLLLDGRFKLFPTGSDHY